MLRANIFCAGMDLEPGKEGGTWLGLNKDGKFAAITNYRQGPKFINANAIGRGFLVPDFLEGDSNVREYLQGVRGKADQYNGFNLLVGKLSLTADSKVGWYCNIEEKEVKMLSPGIHVLSNKVLNCSWPKMVYGRQRFDHILDETCTKQELIDKLMGLLRVQQRLVYIQIQIILVFVFTNSDYRAHSAPLFSKLGILDIYQINTFQIAKFMYCYHNNLLPPLFFNLFFTNSQIHGYSTRTANNYRVHHCRTNLKKFTILYQGPKIWNSLPVTITSLSSFPTFKKILLEFLVK